MNMKSWRASPSSSKDTVVVSKLHVPPHSLAGTRVELPAVTQSSRRTFNSAPYSSIDIGPKGATPPPQPASHAKVVPPASPAVSISSTSETKRSQVFPVRSSNQDLPTPILTPRKVVMPEFRPLEPSPAQSIGTRSPISQRMSIDSLHASYFGTPSPPPVHPRLFTAEERVQSGISGSTDFHQKDFRDSHAVKRWLEKGNAGGAQEGDRVLLEF